MELGRVDQFIAWYRVALPLLVLGRGARGRVRDEDERLTRGLE